MTEQTPENRRDVPVQVITLDDPTTPFVVTTDENGQVTSAFFDLVTFINAHTSGVVNVAILATTNPDDALRAEGMMILTTAMQQATEQLFEDAQAQLDVQAIAPDAELLEAIFGLPSAERGE